MRTKPSTITLLTPFLILGAVLTGRSTAWEVDLDPATPRSPADGAVPGELSAEDWAGIREAYEEGRHAAHPVEGGHEARNPGQRWRTRFDGHGFTAHPDASGWTWGLELVRYGLAGNEHEMTSPTRARTEGGRVTYDWDATLEEWYVNEPRGLEHGYTVHRRPATGEDGGMGPLRFTLDVRGTLRPEVSADGRDIHFLDGERAVALTYTGLTVIDADGRELDASFECLGESLRLSVDESGARYPLTVDPLAQRAYLKASNTGAGDEFGSSVAVSGDTVVVGAVEEASSATGVNGDQSDDSAPGAGAVYVFARSGSSWSQEAYLKASNAEAGDYFGRSVSVSGDTVVVGAHGEDSSSTGVNGHQADNHGYAAGAAYVFVRSGSSWSQQAYLKASNTDAGDLFGLSVSISGDTAVVGAVAEGSNATGVNGDQSDDSAPDAGAAYIFARNGTVWSQQAYVKASNTDGNDEFGFSVAASSDTVVVGAMGEASSSTGVNGYQSDNSSPAAGAVYIFVRSGTSWIQEAYLKASNTDPQDFFGRSVAVSGDTAVVGAIGEDSSTTGVNGDQDDDGYAVTWIP